VLTQVFLGEPALHACAALVGQDQSDGNVGGTVDHAREEEAHRTAVRQAFGAYDLPFADGVIERCHAHDGGNLGKPDVAVVAGSGHGLVEAFDRAVAKAPHRHFHVALSGTYPHLADEHIVDDGAVAVVESDGVGGVCGMRRADADHPFAVVTGGGAIGAVVPRGGHGNGFAPLVPPPKTSLRLLLQHHVVGNEMVQSNLCPRGQAKDDGDDDQRKRSHSCNLHG